MSKSRTNLLLSAVVTLALSSVAGAQSWNGSIDTAWATAGNWSTNTVPVSGSAVMLPTGVPSTIAGSGAFATLQIDSSAAYSINASLTGDAGGSITVPGTNTAAHTFTSAVTWAGSASVTNNSVGLLTMLANNIPNVAGNTLTFGGSGDITINNVALSSNSAGGVVKNGAGTLNLGSASNSGITGGFSLNGGTVITAGQDGVGNRQLNLSNVTLRMDRSNPNSQYTGVDIQNNSTLWFTQTNQWQFGANSPATPSLNKLTSSSNNNPTLTIRAQTTALASTSAQMLMYLNMTEFRGTIDLQDNLQFRLRERGAATSAAAGSAGTAFVLGSGILTPRFVVERPIVDLLTGKAIPTKLGSLSGSASGARMQGARNALTAGSWGTEFEVGALNTSTSYAGIIEEGDSKSATSPVAAGHQGFAALRKVGTGTLTLTNTTNNYKGGTIIIGGTLAVAGDGSLGAAYDGSLVAFSYNGLATTTGSPTITISAPATGPTAVGSVTVGASGYFDIPDATAGTGYIANPTVTITGLSDVNLANGVLATARVKGLVTLDGGTLRTDSSFTTSRAVNVTANNGGINTNGNVLTLAGNLNGSGNFTKSGLGTLYINSASSLGGSTTVVAGTLGGTGSLNASAVVVNSGAAIAPGNSIGPFSVGSATIGGTLQVEYNGTSIDLLNVLGSLDISTAKVDFDSLGAAPVTPLIFASYGTLVSGAPFASVIDLPSGTSIDYNYQGLNKIALVPEPATLSVLAAVTLMSLRRRR
jgi:fibronectin-binding autotransporter adhesin